MAPFLGPVRLAGAKLAQAPEPGADIAEAVHTVAAALASQVARLEEQFELVVAGRGGDVPFLGPLEVPWAFRAISNVAQEFAAIGSSVLEGALRNYVSETDYHTISLDIQRALRIGRQARERMGMLPAVVDPAVETATEQFFLHHIQDLRDLRDAAEQLVVVVENGDVPVHEPGEEYAMEATATLVAVGALVVGGFVWLAVGG